MSPRIKTICKLLEACRYRHDLYNVFSDCIEAMAIAMSNAVDLHQREQREARYMAIVGKYERDVIETFPRILAELAMALEETRGDVMGAVFGALELHNTARGQFFTPDSVCRLMAEINVGSAEELKATVAETGFVTIMEPAVGAGAMVIHLVEAMLERGVNYQQHAHVVAVDVDPRAVHMAYVQFSLLHIPAVLIIGNSITLEEREHWYTPAHILGGWTHRLKMQPGRILTGHARERPRADQPSPATGTTAPPAAAPAAPAVVLPIGAQLTLL